MLEYDYSNPSISYRVFDGHTGRDTTIYGKCLTDPIASANAAIDTALGVREIGHPEACVIQFTRYF